MNSRAKRSAFMTVLQAVLGQGAENGVADGSGGPFDLGRESLAEIDIGGDDAEEVGRLAGGLEELAAEREGELVGRKALRLGEIGQAAEDDGPGRSVRGRGVDEDDVPGVAAGDRRNVILGDVLGVDQGEAGPAAAARTASTIQGPTPSSRRRGLPTPTRQAGSRRRSARRTGLSVISAPPGS